MTVCFYRVKRRYPSCLFVWRTAVQCLDIDVIDYLNTFSDLLKLLQREVTCPRQELLPANCDFSQLPQQLLKRVMKLNHRITVIKSTTSNALCYIFSDAASDTGFMSPALKSNKHHPGRNTIFWEKQEKKQVSLIPAVMTWSMWFNYLKWKSER